MIKKLLEEGRQFYIPQKEQYSFADVQNIIEQHTGFIIKETDGKIGETISLLETSKKEFEAKLKDSAESLSLLNNEKTTLSEKLTALEGELAPIRLEKKHKSAQELLAGLVIAGAEADVYEKLEPKFAEVKFEDGEDITSRQSKVKPLIDDFIKERPYFKPVDTAPVIPNDKPAVITETKGEPQKESEFTGRNVLRMNGN